jgi:hypothetical protein
MKDMASLRDQIIKPLKSHLEKMTEIGGEELSEIKEALVAVENAVEEVDIQRKLHQLADWIKKGRTKGNCQDEFKRLPVFEYDLGLPFKARLGGHIKTSAAPKNANVGAGKAAETVKPV